MRPPFLPDQLAQPVISHIPAAFDLMHLHATRGQHRIRRQDIFAPRIAPKRQHRWVLNKQQRVFNQAFGAQGSQTQLQIKRLGISHAPQIVKTNHINQCTRYSFLPQTEFNAMGEVEF